MTERVTLGEGKEECREKQRSSRGRHGEVITVDVLKKEAEVAMNQNLTVILKSWEYTMPIYLYYYPPPLPLLPSPRSSLSGS